MNLADRLDQIAEDMAVPATLVEPTEIVRAGERLRSRARRRTVVAVIAVGLLVVAASAAVGGTGSRSAAPPAHDEWHVARSLHVPGNGAVLYADGSLWVVDDKNQQLVNGVPAGQLYQIDPRSGDVKDRLNGAVGGWATVGGGYIWLSTLAGDLDVLTRVDLNSHEVARWPTAQPKQPPHGATYAAGHLWVANSDTGDLVELEPDSGQISKSVHVGDPGKGATPFLPFSDGTDFWVSTDDGQILRYNGTTGALVSRVQLPTPSVRLVGIDQSRRTLYAVDRDAQSLFEVDMASTGTWTGRQLTLSRTPGQSRVAEVAIGDDAMWIASVTPDRLLRVDAATFTITATMRLTGLDHQSNTPIDLALAHGALWIRTDNKLQQVPIQTPKQ